MNLKYFFLVITLSVTGVFSGYAQSKFDFIGGFNFYNSQIESNEFGVGYNGEQWYQTFYLAPFLGLQYNFNQRHTIRYLRSSHVRFAREVNFNAADIMDIRTLDRLNYLFRFKNNLYVTSGFTYLLNKAEVGLTLVGTYPKQPYYGNFGFNIGFGKEFNRGFIEISNLYAYEFSENSPGDLFGYWELDFGYYFNAKKSGRKEKTNNKKTVFGFGLVGSLNFFDNRATLPSHSLLQPLIGVDIHYNILKTNTTIFWKRMMGLSIVPYLSGQAMFSTQWNNIGIRQGFNIVKSPFFASASYLGGYDAIQIFPELLGAFSTISGVTIGFGKPVKNWMFELSADYYISTPLQSIETGLGWDRIKLSTTYNFPVISK